jgi:hypothetical protein
MTATLDSQTGYVFNFQEHGAFGPNGKLGEVSQSEIDAHNKRLAQTEIEQAKQSGTALLYERDIGGKRHVGTWDGSFNFAVSYRRTSWHNMAGKDGRTDYYFTGPDGKNWHGVNIGDNQIVRCHRLKRQ